MHVFPVFMFCSITLWSSMPRDPLFPLPWWPWALSCTEMFPCSICWNIKAERNPAPDLTSAPSLIGPGAL